MMEPFALSSESLAKILQVAGNQAEILAYFQSALTEKIKKSGAMPELGALLNQITMFVDNAEFQQEGVLAQFDLWSGAADLGDKLRAFFSTDELSALLEFIAAKLVSNIPEGVITLHCEISDEATFKRAYLIDGKPMEGVELEVMDNLFNAWLAQQDDVMIMQDGVIYAGTDKGDVAKDRSPNAVKVRAEKIKAILSNPVDGFEHYVQEKKKGTQLVIKRYEAERDQPAPSQ